MTAAQDDPAKGLEVDHLAQEIRRVDGNHLLGAGALAEALMPFIAAIRPANPSCQACAGRIEGWTCQGCGATFRERDGKLIMDRPANPPATAAGVGEAMDDILRKQASDRSRYLNPSHVTPASHDALIARVREALERHDALAGECRIDGVRPQRDTTKDCDRCGAGTSQSCGAKANAAYAYIKETRALLTDLDARDGG